MAVDKQPQAPDDPIGVAVRSIHAMADGDAATFEELFHPDAHDRENPDQPPPSRVPGPQGFYATAQWLRGAFADLRYEIHHAMAEDALVAVDSTMRGRQTGPWVTYDESGTIDTVFPATHKSFAVTQSHWFRLREGMIIEHWANRDDLGLARQLGWIPPSPTFLFKMAEAKRRAVRAAGPGSGSAPR